MEERQRQEQELQRLRQEADAGNPFKLPQNETEILHKGEIERRRKQLERELFKDLLVHEKTTMASRVSTVPQVEVVKQLRKSKEEQAKRLEPKALTDTPASSATFPTRVKEDAPTGAFLTGVAGIEEETRKATPPSAAPKPKKERPRAIMPQGLEKENVRGFVLKKREMFLVQMRLDVKRAEILKLEEKARMKEEALKKSQAMLDEDITRFDTFLQENDGKAHKATKYAEEQVKKRQEKMSQIKQIRSQTASIQSETAKLREQGEEAIRYKRFLEELTPQEWKDQQLQVKLDRKKLRKTNWVNARMDAILAEKQAEMAGDEAELNARLEELRRKMKRAATRQAKEVREEIAAAEAELAAKKKSAERMYPSRTKIESQYQEEDSEEELPLYFVEPQQLVDAFVGLEEQNLFLIQNVQLAEQELEELEARYEATMQELGSKTSVLRGELKSINRQVKAEQKECAKIKETFAKKLHTQAKLKLESVADIVVMKDEVHSQTFTVVSQLRLVR